MGIYLAVYNVFQLIGWLTIVSLVIFYAPFTLEVYSVPIIRLTVIIFQNLMGLEILHSLLRLTPSPLATTFMQVGGRICFVWGCMELEPKAAAATPLLLAWSSAEVIRYSHYLFASLGTPTPKFMLWLRYSAFIVLCPMGIFSEILWWYAAFPIIEKCCPRVYSIEMPNAYNFAFDYLIMLKISLPLTYIIGFPYIYKYMLTQRTRKIKED
ncbi:PTPLA [Blepharisma stoltei]|uniref:very-long-chain (3R)-3-hydroxyacyl-CoA dehydratase n=1 Tax=Blepharisma stoltei TaxID=1481888 RepID=A0AAU9K022_9CILI|nr:unnamed protein product [Blepharisma stoltei]